ncbi:alpha/beta hydrolase [Streptomyces aquilus]|uniref:alpha/beta hydrolase n=1 Tax=Streptomyces aquilus TaxID=2548456 RepID=UPI0036BF0E9C
MLSVSSARKAVPTPDAFGVISRDFAVPAGDRCRIPRDWIENPGNLKGSFSNPPTGSAADSTDVMHDALKEKAGVKRWDQSATSDALEVRHVPARPRAALLVLPDGPETSQRGVWPWHLSVLRMRPVLRAASCAVCLQQTLLGHVHYRSRGWNQGAAVDDVLRALNDLDRLAGRLRTVLVGHGMGARAALQAAVHPQVCGVVGLAPWLPDHEPVVQLTGHGLLLVQSVDSVTGVDRAREYALRARTAGARADVQLVRGEDAWMLRHSAVWHRAAATGVRRMLALHDQGTKA